jgi:hypothetical protein
MEFINQAIIDKNLEIKNMAVYNLPCYYCNYRNSNEEIKKYFNNIYLELSKEGSIEI